MWFSDKCCFIGCAVLVCVAVLAVFAGLLFSLHNTKPMLYVHVMVRNESRALPRLLTSLKDVQGVYLCDTGSTDDTLEQAAVWSEQTSIPVVIYNVTFDNFEQARNDCLRMLESNSNDNEWVALMDADFTFEGAFSETPKEDVNTIQIHAAAMGRPHNALPMLVRMRTLREQCTYRLWTHEFLECQNATYGHYNAFHYVDHADGSSRPQKLTRDIALLREWIKSHPQDDALQPRALYYLARAHEDNGELERAVRMYRKHNEVQRMSNYLFYAHYRLAHIEMKRDNRTRDSVVEALLDAFGTYDGIFRREPLYYLTRLFRTLGEYDRCIVYGTAAMHLPPIEHYRVPLFLESTIYDWALEEELAICLYVRMHFQKAYNHFMHIRAHHYNAMDAESQRRVDAEIKSCKEKLNI